MDSAQTGIRACDGPHAEALVKERHPSKGRRELNKEEKLRRIKMAAHQLFTTKGYDDTTTREIATRAGVALGTIFVYAENKRDLLFLVMNDDLDACVDAARQAVKPEHSLFESLLLSFRVYYEYFAGGPIISRAALREMYFYQSGKQAERFAQGRERLAGLLCDFIAKALNDRLIDSPESAECIADTIFAVYQVEVRRWLMADRPGISQGVSELGRKIRVVMQGLSPRPEALAVARRRAQS
jgi:AcrR family transcriptional regulator